MFFLHSGHHLERRTSPVRGARMYPHSIDPWWALPNLVVRTTGSSSSPAEGVGPAGLLFGAAWPLPPPCALAGVVAADAGSDDDAAPLDLSFSSSSLLFFSSSFSFFRSTSWPLELTWPRGCGDGDGLPQIVT